MSTVTVLLRYYQTTQGCRSALFKNLDPAFPKHCEMLIYNFFIFFGPKIAVYLHLGLHKGRTSYRRSLQPSKENIVRIFKRLWSPGIDSKEWIRPAYVALAGRYDNPIPTRFLAPIDSLKIPSQHFKTFLYFFLYLWVIFALLDPDPATQLMHAWICKFRVACSACLQ